MARLVEERLSRSDSVRRFQNRMLKLIVGIVGRLGGQRGGQPEPCRCRPSVIAGLDQSIEMARLGRPAEAAAIPPQRSRGRDAGCDSSIEIVIERLEGKWKVSLNRSNAGQA